MLQVVISFAKKQFNTSRKKNKLFYAREFCFTIVLGNAFVKERQKANRPNITQLKFMSAGRPNEENVGEMTWPK